MATGLVLAPFEAAACSCVRVDPWRAYDRSDAAFVGVFLRKSSETTYRFRVEEDFKADLGPELDVHSARDGAACGLEARVGARLGLFLTRVADHWQSHLCSQARPEQVRAAARGLPRPTGRGPVRMLVGGSFGAVGIWALDTQGRPLVYGRSPAPVRAVAACGSRSVELAGAALVFRDLRTMRVLRSVRVPSRSGEASARVHCFGGSAFAALMAEERTRVIRARGRTAATLRVAAGGAAAFAGRYAYLADRSRIFSLDLRTRATRTLARFTAEQLAVNADGTRLAALSGNRLAIVRLPSGRVTQGPFVARQDTPRLVWDGRRLALVGWENGTVYDDRFRVVGRLPSWFLKDAVGLGGRIAGVGYGDLRIAQLPRGPVRFARDLLSPETYAIAAVPHGPRIRLSGTLPCARG